MSYTSKKLPESQIEFTITVTPDAYAAHLASAAKKLSERVGVKGFRKGHVPLDILKKEVGEMAILQEAMEKIVQTSYIETIKDADLHVIGMPQIHVEKVAPGNDVVYKATVALLPEVTLADVKKIKVKAEDVKIGKEKVQETIDALRGMHATEVKKDGAATGTDKVVLDMDMSVDKVPVDGGQAKDYQVYLSEDHYIPGFNKEIEGTKAGEEKSFSISFPEDHYQKMLAGKNVDFTVKIKEVFERQLPEMTDEFAEKLGQKSVKELETLIESNLLNDAKRKAEQKVEIDILDALIEKSKFEDLPAVLVDSEKQKIFHELKRDLDRNGVAIEQYLADIKKDEKTLFEEFTTQATQRAKAALISRQVAVEQNIIISAEEIDAEVELMKQAYAHNKEAQDNLKRADVRDAIATTLQNKKVMDFLKKEILGDEEKKATKKKAPAKKKAAPKKKKEEKTDK